MKQIIYNIAIFIAVCLPAQSIAQVNGIGNLDKQPAWGPLGHEYAENYFFPDLNVYYNVPSAKFVYNDYGMWVTSEKLPLHASNYNLYSGRKIVLNTAEPWKTHASNVALYGNPKECNNQLVQRDAYDMWNFHVTTYSGYKPKCETTQVATNTIVSKPANGAGITKSKSYAGYKAKSVKSKKPGNICARKSSVRKSSVAYKPKAKAKVSASTGTATVISCSTANSYAGYKAKASCAAAPSSTRSTCVRNAESDTWSCMSAKDFSGYRPNTGAEQPACVSCASNFSPHDYSCVTTESFSGFKPQAIIKSTQCAPGSLPPQ
jgi:hypothetical protein